MNFVFPFGVIFLWVLVLPLYWHPLKTPFPLFHLWVTKKDGSLYKFLLNLVLEENNHGIEKVRSTKAVWIIKWLLSCLEGPALFHMLPWDSYSKEVEQLQTFCWNLIPSFWPVHRRKVFFFFLTSHDVEASSQIHEWSRTRKSDSCSVTHSSAFLVCLTSVFWKTYLLPRRLLVKDLSLQMRNSLFSISVTLPLYNTLLVIVIQ